MSYINTKSDISQLREKILEMLVYEAVFTVFDLDLTIVCFLLMLHTACDS